MQCYLGENGILKRATDAKERTDIAQIQEEISIAWNGVQVDGITKGFTIQDKSDALKTELDKNQPPEPTETSVVNGTDIKVKYKGYETTIKADGTMTALAKIASSDSIIPNETRNPGVYEAGTDNLLISWNDLKNNAEENNAYLLEFEFEITDNTLDFRSETENDIDLIISNEITEIEKVYGHTLKYVYIPNSVTNIAKYAFSSCEGLTYITISNSETDIGDNAFNNCENLSTATLNGKLGKNIFNYCTNLSTVTIESGEIGESAFSGLSSLTSVTIGNGVTKIGAEAFYGCTELANITIPSSVTEIDDECFGGCENLSSITLMNGVTKIGVGAFYGCSITSISVPGSVTSIGSSAFFDCKNLTTAILNGNLVDEIFTDCPNLSSITIQSGEIGASAFSGLSSLTSVTIGNGVTRIENEAFSGCGDNADYNVTTNEWEGYLTIDIREKNKGTITGAPWGWENDFELGTSTDEYIYKVIWKDGTEYYKYK